MISTYSIDELKNDIATFLRCDTADAEIYLRILSEPATRATLSEKFSNLGNLEGRLEKLSSFCLIADRVGREKQFYYAIDPQFAFPALVLSEMWKVDADLHTVNDLVKQKELIELNARYRACQTIVKRARELYKKQLPILKEAAIAVKGVKRIASCIAELLDTANTDIYAVLSPPHLLGEIVWQTVVEKMNQGVSYKRITTFEELIRHGYQIYSNEVNNYNEQLYICRNPLPEKFYVINNITIAFFAPDTKNKDFKFEVQIMNNADFANRRKDVFEKLRTESINLTDLIDQLTAFRMHFISNAKHLLNDSELGWLIKVFDYGVFCKHNEFITEVFEEAKAKSLSNGFINITPQNEILANYTLQEVLDYAA
ncbi:MAG TPA: hypothetical protein PK074_12765 [Spirochaetales bacterium]|nr:hypothetical protein [Spirochaetales bacterium]